MTPASPASPLGQHPRLPQTPWALSFVASIVCACLVHLAFMQRSSVSVDVGYSEAATLSHGPTAYAAAITVNSTTTTALRYSSTATHAFGICSVETSGLNVYVVSPTATATTGGDGPYCDTCANGPRFVIGQDYARTSSSSGTVRCRFYDAPLGALDVGGGMSRALADSRYVELTGDTMSGLLSLRNNSAKVFSAGSAGNEWLAVYSVGAFPLIQETSTTHKFATQTSALATCSSTYDGVIAPRYKAGTGSGVCLCGRDAAGTYGWVASTTSGTFASGDC